MTDPPPAGLAEAVSQLYGLAPGVFIKERNAAAGQAKSAGDRALSDRIKVLPKPSIGVWLLNQLARHRPGDLARVLGLSDALRAAQDEGDGDELRRLSRVRGEVMRAVIAAGRSLGDELGQAVSDSIAGEIDQALRAALADQDAARALVSGQLVRALESTGFGGIDLDGVLAAPELRPGDVLAAPIEPSAEGLGEPGPAAAPDRRDGAPAPVADLAKARRAAQWRKATEGGPADRDEDSRRQVQQRQADQAAADATQAAQAADQALAEARHEADETADQLEELAARLSAQREQIRELELAARAARKAARDADRTRRHLGIVE